MRCAQGRPSHVLSSSEAIARASAAPPDPSPCGWGLPPSRRSRLSGRAEVALGEAWGQTRIGRRLLDREVLESASTDDLEEFAEVSQIDALGSDERGLLIDAICPLEPLDSEVERLRTYALLLNLAGELGRVPTEEDVFRMVSEVTNDVPPVLLPSVDGWLVYQVRDALAVAHEVALAEVVKFLEAGPAATGRSMPARPCAARRAARRAAVPDAGRTATAGSPGSRPGAGARGRPPWDR